MATITMEQLEELKNFDTPTICNALECFKIRPNNKGILSAKVMEILGYGRPFIGYAVTGKMSAAEPAPEGFQSPFREYYTSIKNSKKPAIAVIEDIDPEPIGSFWGEVNAHIHMSLGVVATVTNGGVRDIREVRPMGFGYYATCKLVSHAYNHLLECNGSVNIFGVTINPGDLIFCDQYGVITIPEETVPELAEVCRRVAAAELPVIQNCKKAILEGKEVDIDELMEWRSQMQKLRKDALGK